MNLTQRRKCRENRNCSSLRLALLRAIFCTEHMLHSFACRADVREPTSRRRLRRACATSPPSTRSRRCSRGLDNPAGSPSAPAPPAQGRSNSTSPKAAPAASCAQSRQAGDVHARRSPASQSRRLPDDPAIRVGPLGLEFLTRSRLAVGTGGSARQGPRSRLHAAGRQREPLAYDQVDHSVGPVAARARKSTTGEGALLQPRRHRERPLRRPASGDARGWILKATLDANAWPTQPFIATKRAVRRLAARRRHDQPASRITTTWSSGEAGEATDDRRQPRHHVQPRQRRLALNLRRGLRDIAGLAYSPTRRSLRRRLRRGRPPTHGGVYPPRSGRGRRPPVVPRR